MAYMPLDKSKMYLDRKKMTKIYDLSQPWGVDTPLWPFPGPRQDLIFPRGQYLGRFHKRTMTYTGTLHAGTHMDAPNHVLHEEEVDRERNGYSLDEIPLEYCIGTGVILDMRHLKDEFEKKLENRLRTAICGRYSSLRISRRPARRTVSRSARTTGLSSIPASIITGE